MLMVVLGAGASYDSVPSRPPKYWQTMEQRLPLANQLFDDRVEFSEVMSRFPSCLSIIPYVRSISSSGRTVEQVLEQLQSEAEHYPERHHQLAAIRYYLQIMLWQCENSWKAVAKGVTNYKTLLDQIERWRKQTEEVCLVTFNYDRMIEDALPVVGVHINELFDYVKYTYKLIKLHGSVNWGRMVDTTIQEITELNAWQIAHELIDRVPDLKVSDKFHLVNDRGYPFPPFGNSALFPAIAIPVQSKQHYECPKEHIDALRSLIPKTTKLLMIGWRAMEAHFLKLMADGIRHRVAVLAISGSLDDARQSVVNLRNAGIETEAIESPSGFTEFIVNREGDEFLRS
jgi:hypothetical protein